MDREISDFLLCTKAKQTIYKDKSDSRRLKLLIAENYKENNSEKEIENIPARELDEMLCSFFMSNKLSEKYDETTINLIR